MRALAQDVRPNGPTVQLGDVVAVARIEGKEFAYVRLLRRARIWSTVLADPAGMIFGPLGDEPARDPGFQVALDQLIEVGARWEWCAGSLTVQAPLEVGQSEPAGTVLELVEMLAEMLEEGKRESAAGQRQH
jgi:hypothetical protein